LLAELEAQKKARLVAVTAKVDAAISQAHDAVAKAQKPPDLDAVLDSLRQVIPLNGGGYGYDPDIQAQNARASSAYQFVAQWQDYLSYRESGNNQQAVETLRNLLNSSANGVSLVPRSEILARISNQPKDVPVASPGFGPLPDITPILDRVKTLDDLEPAIRQVMALSPVPNNNLSQLSQLAFLYDQARNGLSVSLELSPNNYGVDAANLGFARIEAMLLRYLLPRFLGPSAPAPNADEPISDYLARVTTAAETAQDWPLVEKVVTAQTKIARVMQVPPGTQGFLTGLNQEMAGQYGLAVTAYESALRSPDSFISPKLIGDRLAAIKKDHPADYDQAMKATTPVMPVYPSNPYGFNPYAARPGMPGNPPNFPFTLPGAPANTPTPASGATPAKTASTPPTLQTNAPVATPPPAAK
jgi:tetratricopeptide (TPR) repeat protein